MREYINFCPYITDIAIESNASDNFIMANHEFF